MKNANSSNDMLSSYCGRKLKHHVISYSMLKMEIFFCGRGRFSKNFHKMKKKLFISEINIFFPFVLLLTWCNECQNRKKNIHLVCVSTFIEIKHGKLAQICFPLHVKRIEKQFRYVDLFVVGGECFVSNISKQKSPLTCTMYNCTCCSVLVQLYYGSIANDLLYH